MSVSAETAKRAAYAAVLRKIKEGKKLTAADYKFLDEMEARERECQPIEPSVPSREGRVSTLEEDLEGYVLRDGVVNGVTRRPAEIAEMHGVPAEKIGAALLDVQRRVLAQHGFPAARGPLGPNEALALQLIKSMGQIARASNEWELQLEESSQRRASGSSQGADRLVALVSTLKQLVEKRNDLANRIWDLAVKERRRGITSRR